MQLNFAKQYQLENNIRALHYKNISIHEFYYVMIDLRDQLTLIESIKSKTCVPILIVESIND
jgi:hypothetical protein